MIYEIGVHFVPSLPEEKVATKFTDLKGAVEKLGGEIISEQAPKLINLAYTMVKHVAGKNQKYNTAQFSWVKFELDAEKIADAKEILDADTEVLRYLIVKTVKENTLHGHKFETNAPKREAKKVEEAPVATPAEVDKAIDELVTE